MASSSPIPEIVFSGGARAPRVGLGTWRMGEAKSARAAEVRALREGIALGMTLIDTAEMYGEGGAEDVVADPPFEADTVASIMEMMTLGKFRHLPVVEDGKVATAAADASRITVRMVPSTGMPTAEYAASVASAMPSAKTSAERSSGPDRPIRRSSAPTSWLRITPELPRAPSSMPRE